MEKNNTITILVSTAVIVLITCALIISLADNNNKITRLQSITDTVNIAPARTTGGFLDTAYKFNLSQKPTSDWRNEYGECAISSITITNVSGSALTITTHYTYNAADNTFALLNGTYPALNNSLISNTSYVSYTYCSRDYMTSSWGRAVLNNTLGIFAMGILIAVIAGAYAILKKSEQGQD